jgi:hypothetical protein
MTDLNKWNSICTFSESDAGGAPIVYRSDEHVPDCDDARGGCVDIAQMRHAGRMVPGHLPGLRIAIAMEDGTTAVAVLDSFQVAVLNNATGRWLDAVAPVSVTV